MLRALHAATTARSPACRCAAGPALRDRTSCGASATSCSCRDHCNVRVAVGAAALRLLRLAAVVDRPALNSVLHAGGASVFVATDADAARRRGVRVPRVGQLDALLSPDMALRRRAPGMASGAATGAVAARARLQREWEALELAARLLDDEVRERAAGEVQLAKRLRSSPAPRRCAARGDERPRRRRRAAARRRRRRRRAGARARGSRAQRHTVLLEALTLRSAKLERLAQTVAQLPAERLALGGGGSNGGGSVIAAAIRGGSSFLPVWRAPRQLGEAAEEAVLALDAQRATLTVLDEAELGGGDDGGRGGEPPPAAIALPFEAIPMLYLGYQACHQRIATAVSAAAGDGARGGAAAGRRRRRRRGWRGDELRPRGRVRRRTAAALCRDGGRATRGRRHAARRARWPPTPVPQLHEGTLLAAPPGSTLGSHLMSWGELWAVLLPGQLLLLPHAARRPKRVLALGGATLQPPATRRRSVWCCTPPSGPSSSPRPTSERAPSGAPRSPRRSRRRRPTRRRRRRKAGAAAAETRTAAPRNAYELCRAARRARRGPRVAARARERGGDAGGGDARGRREDRGGESFASGGTDGGDADARCAHADGAVARRRLGARGIARAHRPRRRRRGGRRRRRGGRRRRRRGERRASRRGARRRPPDPPAAAGGRAAVGGRLAVGGLRRRRPHAVGGVGRVARDGARAAAAAARADRARAARARRRRRRATRRRSRRRCRASHDALRRRPGDGRRRRGARRRRGGRRGGGASRTPAACRRRGRASTGRASSRATCTSRRTRRSTRRSPPSTRSPARSSPSAWTPPASRRPRPPSRTAAPESRRSARTGCSCSAAASASTLGVEVVFSEIFLRVIRFGPAAARVDGARSPILPIPNGVGLARVLEEFVRRRVRREKRRLEADELHQKVAVRMRERRIWRPVVDHKVQGLPQRPPEGVHEIGHDDRRRSRRALVAVDENASRV